MSVSTMPARPADRTPDLLSPAAKPPVPADERPRHPLKHLLPTDLAGALMRLDDSEIDALLAAVTAEAERRDRVPKRQIARPAAKPPAVEDIASGLAQGKLNAVRAAFKAGVKPSVIARQFGVSQSDVRKALGGKSGRGT
jgi:hypothetical protein